MKHLMCGFLILVLLAGAGVCASMHASASTDPKCEQQLAPATMLDLRTLYTASASASLPEDQRAIAHSLYIEKLNAAAITYSTTMEKLHDWVISAEGQIETNDLSTHNRQADTSSDESTPKRLIFHPRLKYVLHGHENSADSAAFSPDGTIVITISGNNTARTWNSETGEIIHIFADHWDKTKITAHSNDGTRVVTASEDKTAQIWDVTTDKKIHTLIGHNGWVKSAAFSSDDTKIITASEDKTARIWNATTGKLIHTLKGHDSWVKSAAFSADGTLVVTASFDYTARIWDVFTGEEIYTLIGHERSVYAAPFSADGKSVVTASTDGTARIWDLYITEDEFLSASGVEEDAP